MPEVVQTRHGVLQVEGRNVAVPAGMVQERSVQQSARRWSVKASAGGAVVGRASRGGWAVIMRKKHGGRNSHHA